MTAATQILLVRHAETTMIRDNRIHGHLDAPLSENGLSAARKTAQYFSGQRFEAFYCSSLGRALRTAEIIGQSIGMQPTAMDDLRERNYGWLEGQSLHWFEPDLTGPWRSRVLTRIALFFSGESERRFTRRVLGAFQRISGLHHGQRVLMVVHWGILSVLTKYFRGEDMENWQLVGPWTACGITEVHLNSRGWQIIRLDDSRHL